jgi:hypothetical protein
MTATTALKVETALNKFFDLLSYPVGAVLAVGLGGYLLFF